MSECLFVYKIKIRVNDIKNCIDLLIAIEQLLNSAQ